MANWFPVAPEQQSKYARQVRMQQFLEDVAREWQQSHEILDWVLMDRNRELGIYAEALVKHVDLLVEERLKEELA